MRAVLEGYRNAIHILGLGAGLGFATRELIGGVEPLPIRLAENGSGRPIWARPKSTDLDIFDQIFRRREYDFSHWTPYWDHMRAVYDGIVAQGRTPLIIDGGANAGYSPIWFALTFPKAKVLAVEPDAANFEMLSRNVAAFDSIAPVEAALWNERATVAIVDPSDWAWGRRFDAAADGPGIPSVTVPELMARVADASPFIIKIDIEGAETKLLRSQTEWMDAFPLVVFETHDQMFHWLGPWQGSAHSFFSTLSRRKREYLIKGENMFAFLHPDAAATGASAAAA